MTEGRRIPFPLVVAFLLAGLQLSSGQGNLDLPCGDDNLSCETTDVCYPRSELCDGDPFCPTGSDEGGATIIQLDCGFTGQFFCGFGGTVPFVDLIFLCDGVNDCGNGVDETGPLCANKCRIPYNGGCLGLNVECLDSALNRICRCVPGFGPFPINGDCFPIPLDVSLEQAVYDVTEGDAFVEVCAVLEPLAPPASLAGSTRTIDLILELSPRSATFDDYNGATAFSLQLSAANDRDCVEIPINDDSLVEGDEFFLAELQLDPDAGNDNDTTLDVSSAEINIEDNDFVVVRFTQGQFEGQEGDLTIPITVELDPTSGTVVFDTDVTVQSFALTSTATLNDDYLLLDETVTFPAGSGPGAVLSVNLVLVDSPLEEPDEIVQLLGSTSGFRASFVPNTATALIRDDDEVSAGFEFQAYNVIEGDTVQVCVILRTGTLVNPADVEISTTAGTASAGGDFTAMSQTVQFPAGTVGGVGNPSGRQCVFIDTTEDFSIEDPEQFTVNLALVAGSEIGTLFVGGQSATVDIEDDDMLIIGFNPQSYMVNESDGSFMACLVVLSGVTPREVIVTINTLANGDAISDVDYTSLTDVEVTFAPGSGAGDSVCFLVTLNDDNLVETPESFTLRATENDPDASFGFQGDEAPVTIVDQDRVTIGIVPPPGSGTGGPPTFVVPEGVPDVMVCVEITSGSLERDVIVMLDTMDGQLADPASNAQAPDDYGSVSTMITFTDANQGQTVCENVAIVDDLVCEDTEDLSIELSTADDQVDIDPSMATISITDNDVAQVEADQGSYSVVESEGVLHVVISIVNGISKGPGRQCIVTLTTSDGSALDGSDYTATSDTITFDSATSSTSFYVSIPLIDSPAIEPTEDLMLTLATAAGSEGCLVGNGMIPVTILDDEDCETVRDNCAINAECVELPGINVFDCVCNPGFIDVLGNGTVCREVFNVGDDPHFSIVMPDGKLLCYTVQGEHGFTFNLISNNKLHMNARFVPDSRREEVTWLGSIGMVVQNSAYMDRSSNKTKLRFEAIENMIYIGDKVALQARNIEKMVFKNGKLVISEAPPVEGFKYPSVFVDLQDVDLSFTIKFMNEHLDLFWQTTGAKTSNSHGLIGQFFRKGIEIDEIRKILLQPDKEPCPVMRRPVWSFMEREQSDDQLCWTAMNPGYQGEGLIDGTYWDYLVDDVLSENFEFKATNSLE